MKITVYSTQTCPWCKKVKSYLDGKNLNYEDVDVGDDEERAREMVEKSGQMAVPVIDIDGTIIVGFNTVKIDEALAG